MKRVALSLVALISIAGAGSLSAQGVRFGIGGGLLLPLSDYKTGDKSGFLVGADGTYWLTGGQVGIRIDASYSQTSEASGVLAHKTKMIGGMGELVYAFGTDKAQVRPYVLGGIGLFNVKVSAGGADTSETKVGFGGGAGLAFKVGTGSTRLFVEGRYTSVKAFATTLPFIGIKAGIRFGGK
jgi:opacity protein-like surface antigen